MCGTTFVQTNKSAPRAIQDVKKLSKVAAAIVELMASFEEQEEQEAPKNERYAAFSEAFGDQPS